MYIQGVNSVYDIVYTRTPDGKEVTYGDVFLRDEQQYSAYNFEIADTDMLLHLFNMYEKECLSILEAGYVLPAYDYVLKCSHAFNLLDARGAISVTERQGYILRVRTLAKSCCAAYIEMIGAGEDTEAEAGN